MKNAFSIAALAALLACAAPQVARAGDGREHRPSLTGTWRVTVTLRDCVSGAPRPSFHSLLTFGADGSLIETTNNAGFKPGQRSPGHGIWRRAGGHTFTAYSDAFIQFSSDPTVAPPAPGFTRGLQRISQTITIDRAAPDAFSSVASIQFFDDDGNLLMQGCATADGTRFE
jgi:hypothetical protein